MQFSTVSADWFISVKVRKRAKIRNRYNQAPDLAQHTNGKVTTLQLESEKVTTLQLDVTNESQEISLKCGTRHRGYPGIGIIEGISTHNPDD